MSKEIKSTFEFKKPKKGQLANTLMAITVIAALGLASDGCAGIVVRIGDKPASTSSEPSPAPSPEKPITSPKPKPIQENTSGKVVEIPKPTAIPTPAAGFKPPEKPPTELPKLPKPESFSPGTIIRVRAYGDNVKIIAGDISRIDEYGNIMQICDNESYTGLNVLAENVDVKIYAGWGCTVYTVMKPDQDRKLGEISRGQLSASQELAKIETFVLTQDPCQQQTQGCGQPYRTWTR